MLQNVHRQTKAPRTPTTTLPRQKCKRIHPKTNPDAKITQNKYGIFRQLRRNCHGQN